VTTLNVQRLCPLWWQNNWLFHHNNAPSHTSFFAGELWTKKLFLIPTPPYSL
jgi:hypothetical protein